MNTVSLEFAIKALEQAFGTPPRSNLKPLHVVNCSRLTDRELWALEREGFDVLAELDPLRGSEYLAASRPAISYHRVMPVPEVKH